MTDRPTPEDARALSDALDRVVLSHDPREQQRRITAQAARIRQLERELGINPRA